MKIIKFFIISILSFIIISCGKSKDIKNLESVDLVLDWYPNALHSFIYTAIEKGYFEEEGLKVNIRFPSTPNDPIALTAAGKADIGLYYMHEVIMKKTNENIPIKSIGAVTKKPSNVIISLKDKEIFSPEDLAGKKIGYSGSLYSESIIKSLVKNSNKDIESVKLIDVGFELLTAMITNQVDATIGGVINHEIPVMEDKGFEINYFTPEQYGIPNHYGWVFIAGDETILNKKDTLKKFLKASERAISDVKNSPYESVDLIIKNQQKESFPLSKNIENKSIDILIPMMISENGNFFFQDKNIWEQNNEWLLKENLIDKKIPSENFFINLL
ncbi:ABC transporter substrate-binding protein [Cetobacterium sp. 2A]|uniref:ABC transporter substrate-binding protein n=1 Tax=unclassified Cetobacterium TaxID=2630983 RepID=UPI00163C0E79|nr:ABC transporter substrate-binding protein [Cetobacterium sp. 2A]MBC2857269.1 ABC transporter substrate-binding protein [Cetobacterium sp. 2A]